MARRWPSWAKSMPDLVVLDADLAGATKTGIFKKAFPERHFDCGIAEAQHDGRGRRPEPPCGLVPFASSFAMFAAGRAFEQVRNSVGYPHLNVKIGATHGGISVGEDGATHQCSEDFAAHAHHPRHGGHVPLRRHRGQGRCHAPPPSMSARSICASGPLGQCPCSQQRRTTSSRLARA